MPTEAVAQGDITIRNLAEATDVAIAEDTVKAANFMHFKIVSNV
jgi:hypothetical protein